MQLIVVREHQDTGVGGRMSPLRYALSTNPLSGVVLDGLDHLWKRGRAAGSGGLPGWGNPRDARWILPRAWRSDLPADRLATLSDDELSIADVGGPGRRPVGPWIVVTNGRFATCVNHRLLARMLAGVEADVVAVNADSGLLACRERVRLTPEKELVGYRRLFADSAAPMPLPADWPHYLLVRPEAFKRAVAENLSGEFDVLVDRCRANGLTMRGIAVAGSVFDLESEPGMLAVCRAVLDSHPNGEKAPQPRKGRSADHDLVSAEARLIGPVLLGKRVTIEPGAVIAGPAVLCDDCVVRRDAVVDSSIVGAGVSVESGRMLRNCLALELGGDCGERHVATDSRVGSIEELVCCRPESAFRSWPKSSYAGRIKRAVDAVAALAVLILFAPVFPLIALAIRISSPGPVFFRDKRQGLHGELFDCIKFRTMRPGADKMQDKLRFVCEVDGPQFKMVDDPRITTVGRFLRETYLDEIPQFYNVLCGQMSVVGPRPSPESENTLCPLWRDARLSVRPGITGLWQVRRTRAANKDFQEWIQYDTQYVRDLSPGQDLWICWRTFRRMVENFVNQF